MKNSKIEWCDHTFNPWRGCTKVSTGCANCYAETLASRFPDTLGVWGDNGTRVIASEAQWKEPIKWNKQAQNAGVRKRVFCASMADVFEDRPELEQPRDRLFDLISATPNLDWLILTKRSGNIEKMTNPNPTELVPIPCLGGGDYLPNIIWGTSVENQEQADKRIPELLKIPGRRFLSCEPLLGAVDLLRFCNLQSTVDSRGLPVLKHVGCVDWVIVGGESGLGARPMHPDWVRSLRNQCKHAGVPFFFKQWGEYCPGYFENPQSKQFSPPGTFSEWIINSSSERKEVGKKSFHAELSNGSFLVMEKVGKKNAGRMLDGREWNEFPGVLT
jgi:protein gp37